MTQQINGSQIKNGTITANDVDQTQIALKSDLVGLGVSPTGCVLPYAGSSAPSGWVLCDGTLYNRHQSEYSGLYTVIGYVYGGNGNHFNVPDLQGRVPIGSGTGSGLTERTVAQTGGAETHTLSLTEIPNHQHYTQIGLAAEGVGTGGANIYSNGVANSGQITSAVGGGGAHNNMQPFLVLNYIIKL